MEFCEWLEFAEMGQETSTASRRTTSTTGAISHAKSVADNDGTMATKPTKSKKSNKWCELHQCYGHDMNQCKVMRDQAKRMRAAWETAHPNQRKRYKQNGSSGPTTATTTAKAAQFYKKLNKKKQKTMKEYNISTLEYNEFVNEQEKALKTAFLKRFGGRKRSAMPLSTN